MIRGQETSLAERNSNKYLMAGIYTLTGLLIGLGVWFSLGYSVPADPSSKAVAVPDYNGQSFQPGIRISTSENLKEYGTATKTAVGDIIRLKDGDTESIQLHRWVVPSVEPDTSQNIAIGIARSDATNQNTHVRIVCGVKGRSPLTLGYRLNLSSGAIAPIGKSNWDSIEVYKTDEDWIVLLNVKSPSVVSTMQVMLRPDLAKTGTGHIDIKFLDVRDVP